MPHPPYGRGRYSPLNALFCLAFYFRMRIAELLNSELDTDDLNILGLLNLGLTLFHNRPTCDEEMIKFLAKSEIIFVE